MKRSTNFNRWRKVGRSAEDVADLLQHYGVTADELRAYHQANAGSTRKHFTCPRCNTWVEAEIGMVDHTAVCPHCENTVVVPT